MPKTQTPSYIFYTPIRDIDLANRVWHRVSDVARVLLDGPCGTLLYFAEEGYSVTGPDERVCEALAACLPVIDAIERARTPAREIG
jgi:hypothetical protein